MSSETATSSLILKSPLQTLAELLAYNHVHLSLSGESVRESILKEKAETVSGSKPRIIAVVGAGASTAAGLPGTTTAIDAIGKLLDPKLLDRELDRLSLEFRLNANEFETRLLAVSKYDRDGVLNELQNLFGRKYQPNMTYELLAHLLKHRFLDAIINFNFDEVLDQSIDDEIGRGNYLRIISDGDCPADPEHDLRNSRFPLPIYLKPHGTVSHKSTMRFTRGDYFQLPPDIHRFLVTLLRGGPVILMVIGFNMQSFEFNRIILDNSSDTSFRIFNFTRHARPVPPLPTPSLPSDDPIVKLYMDGGHIPVTDDMPLQKRMLELWEKICEPFQPPYKPRNVARHDLICSLCPPFNQARSKEEKDRIEIDYLHNRTLVELALATAKAKGFVNTRILMNGRGGLYFQLLLDKKADSPRTLFDMCKKIGLTPCSYSREALCLMPTSQHSAPEAKVMTLKEFEYDGLKRLSAAIHDNIKGNHQIDDKTLGEALLNMFKGDEVEVVNVPSMIHHELCDNLRPIDTMTALKAYTNEALNDTDWDTLLCIAETGEWLLQDPVLSLLKQRKPKLRYGIIVADATHRESLMSKLKIPDDSIHTLEWWLHNQHMTLFLKGRDVKNAFYFERRLRDHRISPVRVTSPDANYFLNVFFAYWLKAQRKKNINEKTVNKARDNFFSPERRKR